MGILHVMVAMKDVGMGMVWDAYAQVAPSGWSAAICRVRVLVSVAEIVRDRRSGTQ